MVVLWFSSVLPMFSYENRMVLDLKVRNDGFRLPVSKITCTGPPDRLDTWKLWGNIPKTQLYLSMVGIYG